MLNKYHSHACFTCKTDQYLKQPINILIKQVFRVKWFYSCTAICMSSMKCGSVQFEEYDTKRWFVWKLCVICLVKLDFIAFRFCAHQFLTVDRVISHSASGICFKAALTVLNSSWLHFSWSCLCFPFIECRSNKSENSSA